MNIRIWNSLLLVSLVAAVATVWLQPQSNPANPVVSITPAPPVLAPEPLVKKERQVIVFDAEVENGTDIFITNEACDRVERLTHTFNSSLYQANSSSPDGTTLAFVKGWGIERELCSINLDGANLRTLGTVGVRDRFCGWTPDSQSILYAGQDNTGYWSLYQIDLDSQRSEVPQPPAHIQPPAPDERVTAPRPDYSCLQLSDLVAIQESWAEFMPAPLDPKSARPGSPLLPDPAKPELEPFFVSYPTSPIPKSIPSPTEQGFLTITRLGPHHSEIYFQPADGSPARRLTEMPGTEKADVRWSPNGQKILFKVLYYAVNLCDDIQDTDERPISQSYFVMDTDGTAPTRISDKPILRAHWHMM